MGFRGTAAAAANSRELWGPLLGFKAEAKEFLQDMDKGIVGREGGGRGRLSSS